MVDIKIVPSEPAPVLATRTIKAETHYAIASTDESPWQKEMNLKLDVIMRALGVGLNDKEKGKSDES
ncbi:hypothetical protein [Gardnerella sp. KA00127]|uniref:hypothetical protein n=1 Tax=Gardnerella sp. KA00127 TaxID=2749070 RepID=UPI003BADB3C3